MRYIHSYTHICGLYHQHCNLYKPRTNHQPIIIYQVSSTLIPTFSWLKSRFNYELIINQQRYPHIFGLYSYIINIVTSKKNTLYIIINQQRFLKQTAHFGYPLRCQEAQGHRHEIAKDNGAGHTCKPSKQPTNQPTNG